MFPYMHRRKCSFCLLLGTKQPASGGRWVQQQPVECVSSHWLLLACIKSCSGKFNQIHCAHPPRRTAVHLAHIVFLTLLSRFAVIFSTERNGSEIKTMKERRNTQPLVVRCKLVLVGDVQCGKTAMLQVLAKDCYPETYVPTVFENYTACLELEEQRVELSLWDTSGSPYYDNVRPLCYSDSDAVLLCFDISRPDTVDSSLKKWKTEILDFCPSTRILLIGCKTDLRTDVCTLMELSNQKQTPVTYEQGSAFAKQLGAEAYLECSAFTSEKSIHSVFRTAAMACMNKLQALPKNSPTRRLSKRLLHLPSKSDLLSSTFKKEKTKSCSVM
ncbi:Rho-related GTP-binding protein [Takifugu flavidus]|uniref:Rho-related GTP-binding protein Rho6 n=2 Tax=Takifugu flavidus TaxID=433684 RepID=A0A5C6MN69_9TELE|nr:Rho-related GTP-binding protein [Takifugu flavidus]